MLSNIYSGVAGWFRINWTGSIPVASTKQSGLFMKIIPLAGVKSVKLKDLGQGKLFRILNGDRTIYMRLHNGTVFFDKEQACACVRLGPLTEATLINRSADVVEVDATLVEGYDELPKA